MTYDFSPQGDFVIHTTMVQGGMDVALTPAAPLHALTAFTGIINSAQPGRSRST